MEQEKKQEPTNNDVAAFASRAKVVYPINQKYRVSLLLECSMEPKSVCCISINLLHTLLLFLNVFLTDHNHPKWKFNLQKYSTSLARNGSQEETRISSIIGCDFLTA